MRSTIDGARGTEVYLDDMPIHTFDPMDNGFFNLCGSGTNYDITTWTLIP